MTARFLPHAAAAALLALAVGLAPARAQNAPDQPGAPAAPQGQNPMNGPETARVEHNIAELHSRLHITAEEEAKWNAFAQVMRENAARMEQAIAARRAQAASMNALEDLRSYAAVAQAHAEDIQRLVPPFQALYDAMPPQQQKTADEVFRAFKRRPGQG